MPQQYNGMRTQDVSDYLTLYNRYRVFGLPHGRGWAHELPWVLDVVQALEPTYESIKAWHLSKGGGAQAADPGAFGLED